MKKTWLGGIIFFIALSGVSWAKIGGGDITFRVKDAGDVVFTHDLHVGSIGLKCNECHYRLYSTIAQHTRVTMKEMQQGMSCGACHNGATAFDVKGNCDKCHRK